MNSKSVQSNTNINHEPEVLNTKPNTVPNTEVLNTTDTLRADSDF